MAKSKKNIKKKRRTKNGFTLVELLGVIGILAIVMLIGVPIFLNIRDSVLERERENVFTYIEAQASNYASETSITIVSVERLIQDGYLEPDDETDIYDPVTGESLNCYIVTSTFEDGTYTSEISDASIGTKEDGTCNDYEAERDLIICIFDSEGNCNAVENNVWLKDDVTLGVRYRTGEVLTEEDATYSWQVSDGSTSSEATITTQTNLINQNTYRVNVTIDENVSEVTQAINIDKEPPAVTGIVVSPSGTEWAREKDLEITASDFSGSGVAGIYVGNATECTDTLEYTEVSEGRLVTKLTSSGNHICVIDEVGNVSEEPYVVSNNYIDSVGADDMSLTSSNPNGYVQSVDLIGWAIDTHSGLEAYQFTTTENYNDGNWTEIATTNEEISYRYENVTSNGTYYFWVRDAVGNVDHRSITITNIDREINSMSLTRSTSSYETSINLVLRATDNVSGIVAWQVTTSANRPSNWNSVTNTSSFSRNYSISSNGTYYFWVQDAAGNTDYRSITITNIARRYTTTVTVTNRNSSVTSGQAYASGIKRLGSVTTNTGYISSSSFSGNYVYFTARNGTTYTGYENATCSRPSQSYAASSLRYCSRYVCLSGGTPRGSTCVANNGNSYDMRGQTYRLSCSCPSGKVDNCTGWGYTPCPAGYSRDNTWYNCHISPESCTAGKTASASGYCYARCKWDGNYPATCSSYGYDYYCPSGGTLSGRYCYYCNTGSLSGNLSTCYYSCTTTYSYWRYRVTIEYYA